MVALITLTLVASIGMALVSGGIAVMAWDDHDTQWAVRWAWNFLFSCALVVLGVALIT